MFASGTSVVFDDVAVTVSAAAGVSTSPIVRLIGAVAVSSGRRHVRQAARSVGASLTAVTVTVNVCGVLAVPSLTVTVIVAVPA